MLRKKLSFMTIWTPLTLLLLLMGCGSRPDAAVGSNIGATAAPVPTPSVPSTTPAVSPKPTNITPPDASETTLMVTHSKSDYVSFLNPASGSFEKLIVGQSPFAIAEGPNHRVYVSTAEGIAVVDTQLRRRVALVPYQAAVGKPQYGEYRPGGMGIAVSPDGRFVYVGVYLPSRSKSQLEIMDTENFSMTGSVSVGIRPFDVVTSLDGREVYSIDHDSYSVTAIDLASNKARTLEVAPYGHGGFEKPHYAAVRSDGRLLLPYQGRGLVVLDPVSGKYETKPLTGNTHQEGVALTPDGKQLLIVGIGSAGSATGKPNLTVLDIAAHAEKIIPLARMHQMVATSADGRYSYLTGGVTYADTGWNGMTVVDLESGAVRDFEIPDYPLDVQLLSR
ncbi:MULTISPECIES: YncE family protein [unclassified Paenibacillus]|uniref:YncE family protein n=1 Tax=unclassified Paenibacillus TaxID=185978 RepID=UPI00070DD81F|nr:MULTISPECIES: hypothetical protein [unclassified Paenibacillus]KQX56710.1 hypothetical protein ASD40_04760 [Paenibacillus sp. Root444D2]KRE50200.1 hypothetical protein ASG85_22415 [Paenibacillus sp. Soil724D2]